MGIERFGCRKSAGIFCALLLLCLSIAPVPAQQPTPLRIPRAVRPPRLSDFVEGSQTEPAALVTTFTQFYPHDGAPVSQPTRAYISYDSNNLYVGWICKDDPKLIRARVAPRKTIDTDDRVTINIDTFNDHKHDYWFDVNPYGIQYDGRSTDGFGDDLSWEGLWYTEGKITDWGYAVLETIPFRTLRFRRGSHQIWNILLGRFVQRASEFSVWPAVTQSKNPEFVGQFAPIEIDEDISPGRNIQLIPYGLFERDKYLDTANGFQQQNNHHPGLDARVVLHDAFTLDLAANPDFSEIGSDDPKVTANQRYEVVYAERRPFFLENASVFSTPENLFFSRRIVDPQVGVRLTGSVNRWNLGALIADDRAPGEVLAQGESGHGNRAVDSASRIEREFGHQSHLGLFLSNYSFSPAWNRAAALDLRLLMAHNWMMTGQATTTQTSQPGAAYQAGPGYFLNIGRSDNHASLQSTFIDRSPGMNVNLGYLNRTDIRSWENYASYAWKPQHRALLSYGPAFDSVLVYDHAHTLQNWSLTPSFSLSLPRLTWMTVAHSEAYELYKGAALRERLSSISLGGSWYKWLDVSASYSQGKQPDYDSPLAPFIARANNASATITLHLMSRLRMDEIYYYTRLAADASSNSQMHAPADIFTNHLMRSKFNYQFNRDFAFNAILDYNALLPNRTLVTDAYSKQADATLLFTYMPHPGTAVYVGYANTFQNISYDPNSTPAYLTTRLPGTCTDRQVFMKVSYLLRF